MADKPQEGLEDEVWNAILACEQILEAMPNDRHSLRTLAHAYEQVGDHVRAREYLLRLGEVLADEQDTQAAKEVAKKIGPLAQNDPEAKQVLEKLVALTAESAQAHAPPAAEPPEAAPPDTGATPPADTGRGSFNLNEEIALAWDLRQGGDISEDDYTNVVHDLTELSTGEAAVTVSTLHVLQDRGFNQIERLMNAMARKYTTPIIALTNFQLARDNTRKLPLDVAIRRGALPYESLANRVLVAVLNPRDKQLRADMEKAIGAPCFFYLVAPLDFDAAIESVRRAMAEEDEENAKG